MDNHRGLLFKEQKHQIGKIKVNSTGSLNLEGKQKQFLLSYNR